ncbi:hypothetical protein NDR87_19060 [Nocardia sp. CDC159]|uniref:Uncharacterized protein n=1 Tax=Nocardia pulmonis TaxID=2951408 RepID=A0A9X2EBP0_9NOCA|nr:MULTISPECIES: hypothetical protein [Nocardia]MCM6776208.1 hypothetical protein [Nocardia pulmonis]MCM6788466.1 hypothetical protein [Nocardia sp. CDC159]
MRGDALAAAGTQPFVYRSRGELVLATPERTIARHSGIFTEVGFTRDNSRVFARDDAGGLVSLDPVTGTISPVRVDCRCDRIFPLYGTTVGWWQPDGFVRMDLAEPKPVAARAVELPPPRDPIAPGNVLSAPRLLAADANALILDRIEAPPGASWGLNHLSHVDTTTGAVRELGRVDGINTALSSGSFRADGREVLFAGFARDGITCGIGHLVLVTLPDGRIDPFALPTLSSCSAVTDLRWAGAAATATGLLWEPAVPDRLTGTAVWTRCGTQWDRRGDAGTVRYAALTPHATVRIQRSGADRVRAIHSGDLVLAVTTEMRILAHDVVDVRLPWTLS